MPLANPYAKADVWGGGGDEEERVGNHVYAGYISHRTTQAGTTSPDRPHERVLRTLQSCAPQCRRATAPYSCGHNTEATQSAPHEFYSAETEATPPISPQPEKKQQQRKGPRWGAASRCKARERATSKTPTRAQECKHAETNRARHKRRGAQHNRADRHCMIAWHTVALCQVGGVIICGGFDVGQIMPGVPCAAGRMRGQACAWMVAA